MLKLLIATRNAHKVEEIRAILSGPYQFLTLRDFPGAPEVVEDAPTFAGNATKKAIELACWLATSQLSNTLVPNYVLADDSGLEVDALNGAPGVYSARFAALDSGKPGNSSDMENNAKLLRLLKDAPAANRTARFRCVLALTPATKVAAQNASPVRDANEFELQTELFDGTCEGRIAFAPSGNGGFGYDPLFIPDGHERSFAELGEALKNQRATVPKLWQKLRLRLAEFATPQ